MSRRDAVFTLVVSLSCLGAARPAAETESNPALARAKAIYLGLGFDEAILEINRALRYPNRHAELVEIYQLAGMAHAALYHESEATEAFGRLLMIAPTHTLPGYVSPRIAHALEAARAAYAPTGWLRYSGGAPSKVYPGDPITVEVRLENDPLGMVDQFRISYWVEGSDNEARTAVVRAQPSTRIALDLDLEAQGRSGTISYWCSLLDRHGGELGLVGSAEQPLRIAWEPRPNLARTAEGRIVEIKVLPPEAPAWRTWWFWTAVGATTVVIAAGAAWQLWPDPQECSSCIQDRPLAKVLDVP